MKKKLIIISAICALLLVLLPACNAKDTGSLKSLTRPYIAQYECTDATYGGEDLLKKFDYIEVLLEDKEQLQVIYRQKGSERRVVKGKYTFDLDTREMNADIGIFGVKIKQSVTVKNGRFTVSKPIGKKQLIMNFKAK